MSLTCVAVGSPPPKIDWRVDGDLRPAAGLRLLSDSFNGSRVESRLRLALGVVRRAGATFDCHATNQHGRAAKSVVVAAASSGDSGEGGMAAKLFGEAAASWPAGSAVLCVGAVGLALLLMLFGVVALTTYLRRRKAGVPAVGGGGNAVRRFCHCYPWKKGSYDKMEKTMIVRAPEGEGGELPEMEWDHL